MRKYKSKYGKPYIRRLKAGDLKKIMKNDEFGGLWASICANIIKSAHSKNKQVYVWKLFGTGEIVMVYTDKQYMKSVLGEGKVTNREFNRLCNKYKGMFQVHCAYTNAVFNVKIKTSEAAKAIQQLGNVAAHAAEEITGLKGVQK